MSLKSKIEAVIYASEEPVTLAQLTGALAEEAQAELDAFAAMQRELSLQPVDEPVLAEPAVPLNETAQMPGGIQEEEAALEELAAGNPLSSEPLEEPAAGEENVSGEAAPSNTQPSESASAEQQASSEAEKRIARERERNVRDYLRSVVDKLIREYAESERGIEIREVAGGFRMATKPEYHDAVRGFVRSLKPALKLSLQALETLAVVAYKQPVTAAEISEIRGVDSAGVLGGLLTRKLIQTAGRKQVIGRPMLYKTSKEFLVRFGLKDIHELPSMEEFERMAGELNEQEDLPIEPAEAVIERANVRGDAEHIQQQTQTPAGSEGTWSAEDNDTASPRAEAAPGSPMEEDSSDLSDQSPDPEMLPNENAQRGAGA